MVSLVTRNKSCLGAVRGQTLPGNAELPNPPVWIATFAVAVGLTAGCGDSVGASPSRDGDGSSREEVSKLRSDADVGGDAASTDATVTAAFRGVESDGRSSDSAVHTCASLGPVTLTMRAEADAAAYCYLAVDYSSNNSWLTITTAAGDPLPIVWPSGISACSQCVTGDHAIGGNYSALSDGGVSAVWPGQVFPQSTCVSSTLGELMCVNPMCASAGHYIAVMCAYPNGCPAYPPGISPANGSYDAGQPVCVKVPFDYPNTAEVAGILGQ